MPDGRADRVPHRHQSRRRDRRGRRPLGDGVNIAARLESWPSPAASASRARCTSRSWQARRRASTMSASSGSRTSRGRCASTAGRRRRAAAARGGAGPQLPLPDKPSIAVLPFANMSGDPEQDYFADGIVEDIITALSRDRWLFVIARNSSFAYKGKRGRRAGRSAASWRALRARGQRARGRRAACASRGQLIDAATGAHLWAERYDGELEDMFAAPGPDHRGRRRRIEPAWSGPRSSAPGASRPRASTPGPLPARELAFLSAFTAADGTERARHFSSAGDRPRCGTSEVPMPASCSAISSTCISLLHRPSGVGRFDRADRRAAMRKPIDLDSVDAFAHWTLGRTLLLSGSTDEAIAEFETAIDLSPSFAQAHFGLGWALVYSQRPEEAISEIDKAYLSRSPRDPVLIDIAGIRAIALMILGHLRRGGAVGPDRFAAIQSADFPHPCCAGCCPWR